MTIAVKVALLFGPYANDRWEATIELDSDSTLDDLHAFIQATLDFDDDHLYEFFIARTENSRDRLVFDDENAGIYDNTVSSLFPLPEKKKLYYLFDYGDNWLFRITKVKRIEDDTGRAASSPRLASESGTRPHQYPSPNGGDA